MGFQLAYGVLVVLAPHHVVGAGWVDSVEADEWKVPLVCQQEHILV